jgi:hypothetical protein
MVAADAPAQNKESKLMSVRMALAKLMAFAAGGAVIGGGAVHVAEAPAKNVEYVKRAKRVAVAPVKRVKAKRIVAADPVKQRKIRRVVTRSTTCAAPEPQQMAMVPYMPPLPPQPMPESSGGGQNVIIGGSGGMGFGGGFFGGFFGGSGGGGGGSVVVTSTTTGSTSSSSSGGSTSGGSTSTSGGSTSTSSGGITSSTTTGGVSRRHHQFDHHRRRFDFDWRRINFDRRRLHLDRRCFHFYRGCLHFDRRGDQHHVDDLGQCHQLEQQFVFVELFVFQFEQQLVFGQFFGRPQLWRPQFDNRFHGRFLRLQLLLRRLQLVLERVERVVFDFLVDQRFHLGQQQHQRRIQFDRFLGLYLYRFFGLQLDLVVKLDQLKLFDLVVQLDFGWFDHFDLDRWSRCACAADDDPVRRCRGDHAQPQAPGAQAGQGLKFSKSECEWKGGPMGRPFALGSAAPHPVVTQTLSTDQVG